MKNIINQAYEILKAHEGSKDAQSIEIVKTMKKVIRKHAAKQGVDVDSIAYRHPVKGHSISYKARIAAQKGLVKALNLNWSSFKELNAVRITWELSDLVN